MKKLLENWRKFRKEAEIKKINEAHNPGEHSNELMNMSQAVYLVLRDGRHESPENALSLSALFDSNTGEVLEKLESFGLNPRAVKANFDNFKRKFMNAGEGAQFTNADGDVFTVAASNVRVGPSAGERGLYLKGVDYGESAGTDVGEYKPMEDRASLQEHGGGYFEQDMEKRMAELKKMLNVFADHVGAGDVEIEEVEEIIPQIRDHYNISDDTEDEMIVKAYDDGDFDSYEPDHPGLNMDKTWDRHDAARKEKWDINFSPQRTYVQFKDEEAGMGDEQPPPLEESKAKIKKSQLVKIIAEEMSKMLKENVDWIDRSEWKSNQPTGRDDAYEPSDLQLVRDALGPAYYVVDHENMDEFRNYVQKKGSKGPNGEEVVVLLSTVSSPDAGRTNYFKTAHTNKYGKVVETEDGDERDFGGEPDFELRKNPYEGDPEGLARDWDANDTLRNL
tara:strand:- start:212 stop:1555 length:1344 start_codon:yes stop_codon:yes gene_type:complete